MSSASVVRLLEVEPDIGRYLSPDEFAEAQRLDVPVYRVAKSLLDIEVLLEEADAFAALVLDGMLLQQLQLAEHSALRLLGPGDIVSPATRRTMLLDSGCRAVAKTSLAILGQELLPAFRRWPELAAGLHWRMAEQSERLAAQLAICQLPRVEERLLSLLWLLAESWGQVSTAGTVLPINLTHDALGELIGARRPTVTIALGELSDRGALIRQDRGWLLLEAIPQPSRLSRPVQEPRLLETDVSP